MCYAQKVIARSKVIDLLKVDFPIDEKWSVDQKHVRTPRSPVVCLVFRLIITRAIGGICARDDSRESY